ncbi:hypothetical protein [Streptomyces sp. NPDC005374]|uniref:hypothetical protein n=1 Tax=Streptomyces sp. NPDC005374 TaxID=3364713 RepID=UPI00368F35CC
MRVPERVRKSANVLVCLVAVAGTIWGGKEIWQVLSGRHQIDEACAGLVPAGRVLALSPAGGTITHRVADEGTIQMGDLSGGQDCEIFSTGAGEKYGTSSGERWFFTGAVGLVPGDSRVLADDPMKELVDPSGAPTHPAQPLGGGITGLVGDSGVTVQLPCADGESGRETVKGLWARAELANLGRPFSEDGQLSAGDRDTLAEIAVLTANNLADRLGCTERLPDAPRNIAALPAGPTPAADAKGTCGWYGRAGFAKQEQFPDQVLESRTDDRLWDEQCGLLVSTGRATGLYTAGSEAGDHLVRPERPGQWFVSLHTYSGEDAKNVYLTSTDGNETPEPAEPGKAGRSSEDPIWWASSVCDGAPQIHTMTIAYGYDRLMTAKLAEVFRAYVDDVAHRRGCTDVTFPAASAFRAD